MALIAIEWTDDDGIWWTRDGKRVRKATSPEALAKRLTTPSAVVCEPSFYGHDHAMLSLLRELFAAHGHTLVSIGGRAATLLAGHEVSGDTRIWWLHASATNASAGVDWQVAAGHDWRDTCAALDVAHGVITGSGCTYQALQSTAALGPYEALDEATRLALGDGRAYRTDVLVAIALAATAATNRNDYERFLGLTHGGHIGSMSCAVHAWYGERNTGPDGFERESVLTWSAYRRALRWAYHTVATARRTSLSATA